MDYEYSYDEETYYSDEDSYEESEDSFSDIADGEYTEDNPYLPPRQLPIIRWAKIEIGKTKLDVSNMGRIKKSDSLYESTDGTLYEGTPYRIYNVEVEDNIYKNFFVHEIVWQAFNGTVPEGWKIIHKHEYTRHTHKIYSNRLACITIVKNRISELNITEHSK